MRNYNKLGFIIGIVTGFCSGVIVTLLLLK